MTRKSRRWSHHRSAVRRPVTPHADPGTIHIDPGAAPPRMTVVAYGPNQYVEQPITRISELDQWLGHYPVTWINVDGLGSAEIITELGKLFQLHPLALEDVVNTHQRAKCEDYGDTLFCVARMVQGPPLVSEQISFFVGQNFVLTFQEDREGDSLEPVRQRLRQSRGRIRSVGADYLLYELIDACIEGYFPVIQSYGDILDDLDADSSFRETGRKIAEIHRLRSDLLFLRRIVWPHRDALQSLLRGGHPQIQSETLFYLRDSYDHITQLIDILEIYRESCSDLRDFFYSKLSNRTNEIMRVLTIISTLFLPVTFVVGVYGMNFHVMPELTWKWGYPAVWCVMIGISFAFLVFFWRRGWLQSSELSVMKPADDDLP